MSTPTWQPVSGPPLAAPVREKVLAPVMWAPPTTPPLSTTPPVIKTPYQGVSVVRSEYVCLEREGSTKLTACGRLLFLPAITVTTDPQEVTCCFCKLRLP